MQAEALSPTYLVKLTRSMTVTAPRSTGADPTLATSLRHRLRDETRPAHEALDGCFVGMDDPAGRATYERFLVMNHACHWRLEPMLEQSELATFLPEIAARARRGALSEDLAAMRLTPLEPLAFALPPDLPHAIGAAYVLEGSRLGGRFIHRRFKQLRLSEVWTGLSQRFLALGEEPDFFRAFMTRIDSLTMSPTQSNACVEAAASVFGYFTRTADAVRARDEGVAT
ncbi:biliverdin-producing heme oxygenase [Aurantimonas sp. CSK15Z-1]|nr:biliverdin-producing heme oxygenase [Aurantimonas sp. CSK15Z-1]